MNDRKDHGSEIGHLEAWGPDRAIAIGLEGIAQGSLVEIEGGGPALVMALGRDHVELAPLLVIEPSRRAVVRAIGPLVTPAGEDLVGRTIDCLGHSLDGGPEIARDDTAPIFGRDPPVVKIDGRGRLTLGMLVFDLQRVIGCGASLIAAGIPDLAFHTMRHQAAEGRTCIVATPAVTSRDYITARRRDLSCIHVAAEPDAAAAAQWLVPWTAMAIADRLRARGRDVVVLLDDLKAWRPHVRRFAERGTWATQLARISSRAFAARRGSVTLIARADEPIAVPDGFDAVLDLRLAWRGEIEPRPTRVVQPPIRVPTPRLLGTACMASARLREHEAALWHAAYYDSRQRALLSEALCVRACLRLRRDVIDSAEQVVCLLAICQLAELPDHVVEPFLVAYLAELRGTHAERLARIRGAKAMPQQDQEALLEAARAVARSLVV